MIRNNQQTHTGTGITDIMKYCEKVLDGTLYEYMAAEIEKGDGINRTDRKTIKAMMFCVLFSDNRFIGQKDAEPKRIFRRLFPTVYEVFALLKKHSAPDLPKLLQRMEACLILDHVAKRISVELPCMPLFTVHDSVVCPVGMEHKVASIIREEAQKCLGVKPKLKYEYWEPETLLADNFPSITHPKSSYQFSI